MLTAYKFWMQVLAASLVGITLLAPAQAFASAPGQGRDVSPPDNPPDNPEKPVAGTAKEVFPAERQYRLGVEDVLLVSVWRDTDLTREVPVRYLKYTTGVSFIQSPLLLLSVLFVILGGQSFLLGLLAEIAVRTYYESQQKPIYIIKDLHRAGKAGPPEDDPLREQRVSGAPAGGSGRHGRWGGRD
jgi:hypothetical protein